MKKLEDFNSLFKSKEQQMMNHISKKANKWTN